MTQKFYFLPFVLLILLLISCNYQKEKTIEERKEEVIAIHDEVMPKMGDLKNYKNQLQEEIQILSEDSLKNVNKIQELKSLVQYLDDAFEEMFVWMRQFNGSLDEMEEEQAKKYLMEQKEMVQKVNTDIKRAIELAENELENK